jgi:hypothetical protein
VCARAVMSMSMERFAPSCARIALFVQNVFLFALKQKPFLFQSYVLIWIISTLGVLYWRHFEVLKIIILVQNFGICYGIFSLFRSTPYRSGRLPMLAATCRVVRPFVLVDSARITYTIVLLIRRGKSATASSA